MQITSKTKLQLDVLAAHGTFFAGFPFLSNAGQNWILTAAPKLSKVGMGVFAFSDQGVTPIGEVRTVIKDLCLIALHKGIEIAQYKIKSAAQSAGVSIRTFQSTGRSTITKIQSPYFTIKPGVVTAGDMGAAIFYHNGQSGYTPDSCVGIVTAYNIKEAGCMMVEPAIKTFFPKYKIEPINNHIKPIENAKERTDIMTGENTEGNTPIPMVTLEQKEGNIERKTTFPGKGLDQAVVQIIIDSTYGAGGTIGAGLSSNRG